jgi:hypothetical protein
MIQLHEGVIKPGRLSTTDWQLPFFGIHSIMIEKFVAQGEGGGSKLTAATQDIYLYDCVPKKHSKLRPLVVFTREQNVLAPRQITQLQVKHFHNS